MIDKDFVVYTPLNQILFLLDANLLFFFYSNMVFLFISHLFQVFHNMSNSVKYTLLSLSLSSAERTGSLGCIGWFIVIISGIFTICLFPITIWFCLKVSKLSRPVKETESLFLANLNVL